MSTHKPPILIKGGAEIDAMLGKTPTFTPTTKRNGNGSNGHVKVAVGKKVVGVRVKGNSELNDWFIQKLAKSGLTQLDAQVLGMEAKHKQAVIGLGKFRAAPGLYIPYWHVDGTPMIDSSSGKRYGRMRFQDGYLPLDADGKPMRYQQPVGSLNQLYIPVHFYFAQGLNVEEMLRDPSIPKAFTEGEFKAACGAKYLTEFLWIAYGGIQSCFQNHRLLPFFDRYGWADHTIILCNDADVANNPHSRQGEDRLASGLKERGACVFIARDYGQDKFRKLDDYIVGHGGEKGATLFREKILDRKIEWKAPEGAPPDVDFSAPDPVINTSLPSIPKEAMYGELKRLTLTTKMPPSLVYPALLATASALVEPNKHVQVRTNLYCALIGDVGDAKSVVIDLVLNIARKYLGHRVVESYPASDRGLINLFSWPRTTKGESNSQELAEAAEAAAQQLRKRVYEPSKLDNSGTFGYLLGMDEMRVMMSKAGIQNSTLMPALCSLWNRDQYTATDKTSKHSTFPFRLSLLGAIKINGPTQFSEIFKDETTHGFYVRNIFGVGLPQQEPYRHRWLTLEELAQLEFRKQFSRPEFAHEFLNRVHEWEESAADLEILRGRRGGRLAENALRIAYITSAVNGDPKVTEESFQAAICFAEHQEKIRSVYRPVEGDTEEKQCVNEVISFYEKYGVYSWRRACQRNSWHRKYPRAIRRIYETLVKDGVLREHKGKLYLVRDEDEQAQT